MGALVAAVASVAAAQETRQDPYGASGAGVHADAVRELGESGVLEGTECDTGDWCWGEPVSREVLAVWLVRVVDGGDSRLPAGGSRFEDVAADDRWAGHIERLAELGVTRGCSREPLRFCGDDAVTRGQMASFLVRAFDLGEASPAGFGDIAGDAHESGIDALYAAGVTVGCSADPLLFCPGHDTTRAQMASFLNRARQNATTVHEPEPAAPRPATTGGGGSGGGGGGGGRAPSPAQRQPSGGSAPGQPFEGTTSQQGLDTAVVTWVPPLSQGFSPPSGYRLWWALDAWFTDQPQATVPASRTSHTISGLEPGHYYFKIVAVNSAGEGPSVLWPFSIEVVTLLPGFDWLDIRWPDQSGAAGYLVQWKLDSADWAGAAEFTAAAGATSHSVTGLTTGERYTARVTARDAQNTNLWTHQRSATLGSVAARLLPEFWHDRVYIEWEDPRAHTHAAKKYVVDWRLGTGTYNDTDREEVAFDRTTRLYRLSPKAATTDTVYVVRVTGFDSTERKLGVAEVTGRTVPIAEYVKTDTVDGYDAAPWLAEAWDVVEDVELGIREVNQASFGPKAQYQFNYVDHEITSLEVTWPALAEAEGIVTGAGIYRRSWVMLHELAHLFTLDHRLGGEEMEVEPAGWVMAVAAGWLYFHSCSGADCDPDEDCADALTSYTRNQQG